MPGRPRVSGKFRALPASTANPHEPWPEALKEEHADGQTLGTALGSSCVLSPQPNSEVCPGDVSLGEGQCQPLPLFLLVPGAYRAED